MEDVLFILIAALLVVVTQWMVFGIYKKTQKKSLALLPNGGLLFVGLVFVLITYIVSAATSGSWADLAAIIMLMLVIVASGASLLTSVLLLFIVDYVKKSK
jgi:hypothetical protein